MVTKKKCLVLWLDDQILSHLQPYVKILEKNNFEVITSETVKNALSEAKSNKFDIILSDIVMPQTDGIEFLEKVHTIQKSAVLCAYSSFLYLAKYRDRLRKLPFRIELLDKDFPPIDSPEIDNRFIEPIRRLLISESQDSLKQPEKEDEWVGKKPLDWCPTITLTFESSDSELIGDFDTGAPSTFISYEWLLKNDIIKPVNVWSTASISSKGKYRFTVLEMKISLISGDSKTQFSYLPVNVVRDFAKSPFVLANSSRVALIGRDLPRHFQATIEIDSFNKETRVVFQNWSTFEGEVANIFRVLGLRVRRNYNLSGNQIDVFLTERTTSGKELRTIVECKFHNKPIGIQYVRQLVSVLDFAKQGNLAEHAIIVSSSGFTKDAYLVADSAGVDLMEIDDLRARISGKEFPLTQPEAPIEEISTHPKQRTAFIIMPFKDEYRDTYMLGIRETLANDGYSCIRADEVEFSGRIMDQILDLIKTSELIVAEVTEHNPNVYYELGIAHSIGKNVILCTKNVAEIPFDTSDLNHIVYTDIVDLREKLSSRLSSLVVSVQSD